MGQRLTSEKIVFCQKGGFGKIEPFFRKVNVREKFTFPSACAVQTKHGINKMLKKTVLKNMGWRHW